MNFFAFSGLVNGLVCVVCGAVVVSQNPRGAKHLIFGFFCVSGAVWSFFYAAWQMADDPAAALLYARAFMAGVIFLSVLFYHHVLALFRLDTGVSRVLLAWVFYPLAFLFFIANFGPFLVDRVEPRGGFPFWPVPGPLFHPFLVMFFALVCEATRNIWLYRRRASPRERNEITWLISATVLGWLGGSFNFFLWYNIPVRPFSTILVSFYMVTASCLFFRLGLLDARAVFRHISWMVLIYGALLALTLPVVVLLARWMTGDGRFGTTHAALWLGVMIGLVLSAGPVIYAHVVRRRFWLSGHVATGLTHELKTPLGTIQSAVDLMEGYVGAAGGDPRVNEYLDMIRRGAGRLERQVGDLLRLAQVQDGDIAVRRVPFDMSALAAEVLSRFQPVADAKGLTLMPPAGSPCPIEADQEKLDLVLSNLISNAVKFSERGTIRVNVTRVKDGVACSVTDEGRGIPAGDLGKVFDRFYQGKMVSKGAGIGLAIAKAWVEAHGGRIWADSPGLGHGATVAFMVPQA